MLVHYLVYKLVNFYYIIVYYSRYLTHQVKRDFMGIVKSVDPGQPVQSAQANHGRNFLLLADFLYIN